MLSVKKYSNVCAHINKFSTCLKHEGKPLSNLIDITKITPKGFYDVSHCIPFKFELDKSKTSWIFNEVFRPYEQMFYKTDITIYSTIKITPRELISQLPMAETVPVTSSIFSQLALAVLTYDRNNDDCNENTQITISDAIDDAIFSHMNPNQQILYYISPNDLLTADAINYSLSPYKTGFVLNMGHGYFMGLTEEGVVAGTRNQFINYYKSNVTHWAETNGRYLIKGLESTHKISYPNDQEKVFHANIINFHNWRGKLNKWSMVDCYDSVNNNVSFRLDFNYNTSFRIFYQVMSALLTPTFVHDKYEHGSDIHVLEQNMYWVHYALLAELLSRAMADHHKYHNTSNDQK